VFTISAIIPTYNRAKLLGEAVESALQQTRPPDEIVAVDDGSTDNTEQVVAQYGKRLRYVRQDNAGPATDRKESPADRHLLRIDDYGVRTSSSC
jgi:glycosyltransferase involved in cell wall biosynthesis